MESDQDIIRLTETPLVAIKIKKGTAKEYLTPNTPLIQPSFMYSKWNMYVKLEIKIKTESMMNSGLEKYF